MRSTEDAEEGDDHRPVSTKVNERSVDLEIAIE